jgi:hypothetical protein
MPIESKAKKSAVLAENAARKADEIFKKAETNVAVISKAHPVMRKAVESFRSYVEKLEANKEALEEPENGEDNKAKESPIIRLSGQLQTAAAITRTAVEELKPFGDAGSIENAIKKAVEEPEAASGQEAGGVNAQDDSKEADGKAAAVEDTVREADEEQKIREAAIIVVEELKAVGLSKIIKLLNKAADALELAEEAAGKNPSETQSVEDAVREAIKRLKNTVTALKKAAADTQDRLRWPTYEIWKPARDKITKQSKTACENASLVKQIYAQTQLPEDEQLDRSAADDCARATTIEEKATKNYESALVSEVLLKVDGFFEDHKEQIYNRLEECDRIASKSKINPNTLFIAESLPIINGIIHVGSARVELNTATDWVRKYWEASEAHPRIVLSALLFHYVTERGVTAYKNHPDQTKRETWERIRERVSKLL